MNGNRSTTGWRTASERSGPEGDGRRPLSALLEDCAKGLFSGQQHEGPCSSCAALAERLGLSLASTTEMVEHLAQLGLVRCEPDAPLALTRTGALEVIRHRRVVEAELARAQRLSGRFGAGQAGGDEVVQC